MITAADATPQSYFLSMVYRLQEDMAENLITGFSFIFVQVSLSNSGTSKFSMKSFTFQGKPCTILILKIFYHNNFQ